jgi:PhoH-like ATPase
MLHNNENQNKQNNKKNGSCSLRLNRVFVLDTNVLLHDPNSIYAFQAVVIGIPFVVLEELDQFKKETNEKGRNAREVIRFLDELRSRGSLQEGVELNNKTQGAIFKVFLNPEEITLSGNIHEIKDNLILKSIQKIINQNCRVTLVTKDINLRVKADVIGIEAEDYIKGKISHDQFYKGWINLLLPSKELKNISLKTIGPLVKEHNRELYPNQFVIAASENNPENYRLFRHIGKNKLFKEVEPITILRSFEARNIQQLMALDLLMDDDIKLLTLIGPAGTGKTFLTLLVGLYKVAHQKKFRKLFITRPVIALGADIGYLPGDIQEKLHFWMQPVHDNLEFISSQLVKGSQQALNLNTEEKKKKGKKPQKHEEKGKFHIPETYMVEQLQQRGILSLEAITYMRGRSIPHQFMFIDEVQNLTPHEVKTLVSRAGEGTKVILSGDPYQIDSPYLDFTSNGLTVTTEKMKEQSLFGTAFLEKSERSELAKLAAEVL